MLMKIRGSMLMYEGKIEVIEQFKKGIETKLLLSKIGDKLVVQNANGKLCGEVCVKNIPCDLTIPSIVKVVNIDKNSYFVEMVS